MNMDEFNLLKQERGIRVDMDKKKEMLSKKISTVQEYINFLETEYGEMEENLGN
jgi:chaperonin cofactor prefoldin